MTNLLSRYRYPIRGSQPEDHILILTWQLLMVTNFGTLLIGLVFISLSTELVDGLLTTGLLSVVLSVVFHLLGRLEKGQTALVNHFLCSSFLVVGVINAYYYGGLQNSLNITVFFILICMAGILRGLSGLKIYGVLSIAAIGFFFVIEDFGFLPAFPEGSEFSLLAHYFLIGVTLTFVGLLVGAAVSNLNKKADDLNNALFWLKETTVSKEYVDSIIEAMEDFLIVVNRDLTIETTNRAVRQVLGFSESEIDQMRLTDLFSSGSEPDWVSQVANGDKLISPVSTETLLARKNGRSLEISLTAAPMDDNEGQEFIVCVAYDITQRKEIERSLILAKEEAENIARTKSEFLATMSHEIQTPMNGVIGMTELLMETALNSQQSEFVRTIHKSGEALLVIINDILDYSKIEANRVELESFPFVLTDCLKTAIDTVSKTASQKGLTINYRVDPGIPSVVSGDETRLRQVLINLLSNAVKFTEEGSVNIRVNANTMAGNRIELFVAIQDTGIGIPDEKIEHLFKPFIQADGSTTRKYGGTGLGLVISRSLAELMGGRMWMESEVGIGSTFYFTALLNSEQQDSSCQASLPEQEAQSLDSMADNADLGKLHPLKILLVEDNKVNQKVAVNLLNRIGYFPDIAENGQEAVEAAAREEYELIFMDIHMPIMDGLEATRLIKAGHCLGAPPPIYAITASVTDEDRRMCMEAGMDGVIHKPVKINLLSQAIIEVIKKFLVTET